MRVPRSGGTAAPIERSANLLGALSLAIVDRTSEAVAAAGPSDTAAAALSALHHFLDRPSVDRLRQVLGLTHSGTVRLVDRLEAAGFLTRAPGGDGRATILSLTPAGRRAAERISRARAATLQAALDGLSAEKRAALDELMGRLLVGLMREPGAVKWTCRLCDIEACERGPGCPIRNVAREKYSL